MTPEEWKNELTEARRRLYEKFPMAKKLADEQSDSAKTDEEIGDEIIKSLKRACEEETHEE